MGITHCGRAEVARAQENQKQHKKRSRRETIQKALWRKENGVRSIMPRSK